MENNTIQISEDEFLSMYSDIVSSGEEMLAWKCPGVGYGGTGSFTVGDLTGDGKVEPSDARLWLRYGQGMSNWNDSGINITADRIAANKAALSKMFGNYLLSDDDLDTIRDGLINNGYSGSDLNTFSGPWYAQYALSVSVKLITQRYAACRNDGNNGVIYNLNN